MPIDHLDATCEVYKLSHRVWQVASENFINLVYWNRGFKCTCPRFIRTGRCDDIRIVLRRNNHEESK